MGLAFTLEQTLSEMIDWNRYMIEALCQLIQSKEERKKAEKNNKKFKKKYKKIEQTPSEKLQDELEPII